MTPEYTDDQIKELKQNRVKTAVAELRGKLTPLVDEAAGYRKNVSTAKTSVKREFYGKKLKKIQARVVNLLVSINRLEVLYRTPDQVAVQTQEVIANAE